MPSPCHYVVSLDKKLCPTLSLSTQVYKMGTCDILLGGNPGMDKHSLQGGVAILSVASCCRNWDKPRPCGPPWLVCNFTYVIS